MSVGTPRIIQARPIQAPLAAKSETTPNVAPDAALSDTASKRGAPPKDSAFIQHAFLLGARRSGVLVELVLESGRVITGRIAGFDTFTIAVEVDGRKILVFKHTISTLEEICPQTTTTMS